MLCFLFGYFLFNQSKNNAVLEPRTGNFRGPVGPEAMTFNFEAKAKNYEMCSRGQERPRGINLCYSCSAQ